MYTAEKGNKVYTISQQESQAYQHKGYDIFDENHELVARGIRSTVSGYLYNQALDRIDELEKEIEILKSKKKAKGE